MIKGVNFKLTRLPYGIVHNRDMTMYAVPNVSSPPTVTLFNKLLKDTVALKGIITTTEASTLGLAYNEFGKTCSSFCNKIVAIAFKNRLISVNVLVVIVKTKGTELRFFTH